MTPLDYIAAGIKNNDMSQVKTGYKMLTGIDLSEEKKSRGRPKKTAEEKPARKKVGPLAPLVGDKFQQSSGGIKFVGNNFTDDGVSCRENVTSSEREKLDSIHSLLGVREAPLKVRVTCCKCGEVEMVAPIQAQNRRYFCNNCMDKR